VPQKVRIRLMVFKVSASGSILHWRSQ